MTILASAIENEIHQLIQFQIETFRQPVPLNSFQLQEHHRRSEKIRNLSQELDRMGTLRVVEQLKKRLSQMWGTMKKRQGYKGFVIEAHATELKSGGFSVEFFIEEHSGGGVDVTQFHVPNSFATIESALDAALQGGRAKIDSGFEHGPMVVNG
jgi:hypothetical protein